MREKTLDFIALVGTGAFLQPVQQLLFSRKEVCSGCHVLWCFHTSQARPRLKGGLGWAGTVQASGAGPVTRSLTPVSLGVFLAILQQMARPEHGAISLVAFRRARGDGPFEAAWGERYLSARFRQIQRNHKHGRREHVEHKSKHSIHSVGWLGVCARKSTHPTPQSARQVEGSTARTFKDVIAAKAVKRRFGARVCFADRRYSFTPRSAARRRARIFAGRPLRRRSWFRNADVDRSIGRSSRLRQLPVRS